MSIRVKTILAANGFKIPRAARFYSRRGSGGSEGTRWRIVIKIQAWTTGRAGLAGVAFGKKADEVRAQAERMLSMKVGQFPVEAVLVEEKIDIDREFFLSFAIDDAARAPMIIFAGGGGTGIEERAASTKRFRATWSAAHLIPLSPKPSLRVGFRQSRLTI